jgi:hypothetical protein
MVHGISNIKPREGSAGATGEAGEVLDLAGVGGLGGIDLPQPLFAAWRSPAPRGGGVVPFFVTHLLL